MGRALIADPDLVARIREGEAARSRCNSCNICIPEADDGGIRCALDGPRAGSQARLTAIVHK
jgi:2,4-dienoyl-CoA reductase-like NADH-dependent reductase (Old Yellow Enzyme family)